MATKRKNKLQIFMERYGIGEKGPVQKQIESDPYLKWINSGMRSTDYTPEIAAAKRRFIEKQQGAKQQPTYRDTGNVVRIETIEDTVPSERARPRPVTAGGMGGYSQGGLFKSDRGMGVVPDNVDTTSAPPDAPTDLLDAALYESDRYFGTRSPGDEMTAAWQAEQLRRRRAEAPYDLVTAAVGRNPAVVTSGYPARDFSRDPYLGGAGAGGSEMTRAAQRQAELNSASMDMPRGLFGNTWSTSTGTAPYSAERNWGQPNVYIGGGSPGEEIQAEMQRQAALESAGYDFNLPLNGSTYQTTTGTAPTPPVTNWGQTAFPYIGQSGAGGEEIMDAMPPAPPAFIDVQPAQSEAQYWRERLGTGFGGGSGTVPTSRAAIVQPIQEQIINELTAYGITDKDRQASILASIEAESNFKPQSESLNYSAKRLFELYGAGNKYKNKVRFKTVQDAQNVVDKGEQEIAEVIYGGRMGNKAAGEGYKYRGRGYIQLTGKDNYADMSKKLGVDLVNNPELANDPNIAFKIAIQYLKDNKNKNIDNIFGAATGNTKRQALAKKWRQTL